jgi:hypothetical protein
MAKQVEGRLRPQLALWLVVTSVHSSSVMMGFCDFSYLGMTEAETDLHEVKILRNASELHQHQLGEKTPPHFAHRACVRPCDSCNKQS